MTITIPDGLIESLKLTPESLKLELAVYMYEKQRLSIGQARKLAGLDLISFQKELAKRDVYIHYDINDFEKDMENLKL